MISHLTTDPIHQELSITVFGNSGLDAEKQRFSHYTENSREMKTKKVKRM